MLGLHLWELKWRKYDHERNGGNKMIGKIGNITSQGSLLAILTAVNSVDGVDPNIRVIATLGVGVLMVAMSLLSKSIKE